MELEIKGFIEFCRFLAQKPEAIINNPCLFDTLDFCHKSIASCNCSNKLPDSKLEEEYFNRISNLTIEELNCLGKIFDIRGDLDSVFLTFPINELKIKIK